MKKEETEELAEKKKAKLDKAYVFVKGFMNEGGYELFKTTDP